VGQAGGPTVHLIVPDSIDDPARPSGGNRYDRRISVGLSGRGWNVREHPVSGPWPHPTAAAFTELAAVTATIADGDLVLGDGLITSAASKLMQDLADRVGVVELIHLPLGVTDLDARSEERAALRAARAVITTSTWTRDWLADHYDLAERPIIVAEPGVDPAPIATGRSDGSRLLCVGAVIAGKGHDVLLGALTQLSDLSWSCRWVGSRQREPDFAAALRDQIARNGLADRVILAGTMTPEQLERAYAEADVLVLASRGETYSMVITEALARGLPVIATAVGGVPSTLGSNDRPGLLVPAEDVPALAGALRAWLTQEPLRERLRQAAAQRRLSLSGWSSTVAVISDTLDSVAASLVR